jgi:DegV family protein with EDD domain
MVKCKIFTNSVSDIPASLARQYDIGIVPDIVISDEKEYYCGIDIHPPQLYELMRHSSELPTTSHPNTFIYENSFREAADYQEILCLNITSVMSGSFRTASTAAQALAEEGFGPRVYTWDSLQVSCGLTLLVLEAARMAQEGKGAEEIIARLDSLRPRVGLYFALKTLDNARKGGRIGEIKFFAAGLLKIVPMLAFRDGTVKDIGMIRHFDRAVNTLATYFEKFAQKGRRVLIYHGNNEKDALRLKDLVSAIDPEADIVIDWVGPAIGIYAGEGSIAIAFHQ